jgi:putative DNA primase/helicase
MVHLTFPTDDYSLDFGDVSRTTYGALLAKVTARHGDQVLHMARFDLLNQREQEHFHQRCRSVNGTVADWQSRLQSAIPGLESLVTREDAADTEEMWGAVQPLPSLLPEVPTFPAELLPAALRDLATDIAERMQVPLDFIAVPLVITAGAVIGRQCGIFPKRHDDWLVIPNLWGAVVGRPGLMKSPALAQALKPLERLAVQAIEAAAAHELEHATTRAILDAQLAGVKEGLKKAAKSDKADEIATYTAKIEHLQAQLDALAVPTRRYKTNDATIQKLGELLRDNPTGLLLYRDELSGWLSSLRQEGREGDREFFLEAWNGDGGYTFDRIGRGMVHVDGLCLSIVGGIQPGKLAKYVHSIGKFIFCH